MTEELTRLNRKWNEAWLNKDGDAAEQMTTDDYVYVAPTGDVVDREQILEIIRTPSYRLVRGSRTEVSVRLLSNDTALVLFRFQGEGEFEGQSFSDDHRGTGVWVRRDGAWKIALEHCSPIVSL